MAAHSTVFAYGVAYPCVWLITAIVLPRKVKPVVPVKVAKSLSELCVNGVMEGRSDRRTD